MFAFVSYCFIVYAQQLDRFQKPVMPKFSFTEPLAKLFLKVSPGFTWGYSNSTPIGVVPGFTWGESNRFLGLFF